jgi:hypothetical protein
MPNFQNINSPINIHGIGRSGTTLLQNLLWSTGYIQVCNETAQAVFAAYRAGEALLASWDSEKVSPTNTDRGIAGVHASLCTWLPSSKPNWCQKLGGIPNSVVWRSLIQPGDRAYTAQPYEFPYEWYWNALRNCFPRSINILILRNVLDILVSSHLKFGYSIEEIARDVAVYFNILAHPLSTIDHVIYYDDLVGDFPNTGRVLFSKLAIEYTERNLTAADWHSAPSGDETLGDARARSHGWTAKHKLVSNAAESIVVPAVARLAQRLDLDPLRLMRPRTAPASTPRETADDAGEHVPRDSAQIPDAAGDPAAAEPESVIHSA